jgi:hypothetical protein
MMMRPSVRDVHLGVGLFAAATIGLYGVSSVILAHASWFSREPTVEIRRVEVDPSSGTSPRAIARRLVSHHGVRGELVTVDESALAYRLVLVHPGVRTEVDYTRGMGDAVITTRTEAAAGVLAALHEVRGLSHDAWLLDAWGLWFGVIALALLTLALTGVYQWYRSGVERTPGMLLLAVGLAYGCSLLAWLRLD